MATKKASQSAKKLGKWKVARHSDTELVLTVPAGMKITGKDLTIEDVLSAIATQQAVKKGRVVIKCCSGNMAIA